MGDIDNIREGAVQHPVPPRGSPKTKASTPQGTPQSPSKVGTQVGRSVGRVPSTPPPEAGTKVLPPVDIPPTDADELGVSQTKGGREVSQPQEEDGG